MSRPWSLTLAAAFVFAGCGSPAPTVQPVATNPNQTPAPEAVQTVSPTATSTATAIGATQQPDGGATARPTLEPRPPPPEGAHLPLDVDDFGFTPVLSDLGDYATFGAVFTNRNTEWAVYRMLVQINMFGADDSFVGGAEVNVTVLPGQTTAVAGQAFGAGGAVRMVVAIPEDATPYVPFTSSGSIDVTDVAVAATDSGTVTTGTLTSSLSSDQTFLQLFAVYRDDGGQIIGGASGGVEAIASGSSVPFEISDGPVPVSVATADVYWQLGGQLP